MTLENLPLEIFKDHIFNDLTIGDMLSVSAASTSLRTCLWGSVMDRLHNMKLTNFVLDTIEKAFENKFNGSVILPLLKDRAHALLLDNSVNIIENQKFPPYDLRSLKFLTKCLKSAASFPFVQIQVPSLFGELKLQNKSNNDVLTSEKFFMHREAILGKLNMGEYEGGLKIATQLQDDLRDYGEEIDISNLVYAIFNYRFDSLKNQKDMIWSCKKILSLELSNKNHQVISDVVRLMVERIGTENVREIVSSRDLGTVDTIIKQIAYPQLLAKYIEVMQYHKAYEILNKIKFDKYPCNNVDFYLAATHASLQNKFTLAMEIVDRIYFPDIKEKAFLAIFGDIAHHLNAANAEMFYNRYLNLMHISSENLIKAVLNRGRGNFLTSARAIHKLFSINQIEYNSYPVFRAQLKDDQASQGVFDETCTRQSAEGQLQGKPGSFLIRKRIEDDNLVISYNCKGNISHFLVKVMDENDFKSILEKNISKLNCEKIDELKPYTLLIGSKNIEQFANMREIYEWLRKTDFNTLLENQV